MIGKTISTKNNYKLRMIYNIISHYKILEKIGEGGMGEVHLAEDTKLKRQVALKFLSSKSISGEEDKSRFMREAQAAAALNHSNIATIFEIDEHEGNMFIAMEYVEGQNLKQLLESGPLKLRDVIKISSQIAEGLQAAHARNIVHRDIKSANIMITGNGQVKIMDFGLAKLAGVSMLTREGTTVGTVSYMSPEQTHGEVVDQRTDIWSLGVIIYEMVSGQLPFKGQYDSAVIYSIMHEEPEPLTAFRTGLPKPLEGMVNKLLAKDRNSRYQHVVEVPVDLKAIDLGSSSNSLSSRSEVAGTMISQKETKQKKMSWKNILLFVVSTIIIFVTGWLLKPQPIQTPKQVARFNLSVMPGERFTTLALAISPDGKNIVYGITAKGISKLYLRKIDRFTATPIDGTEGAQGPFFSPNGRELCFWADAKLKKVLLDGGQPQMICDVENYWGGTWGNDGTIIFQDSVLKRVLSTGGIPEPLVTSDSNKVTSYSYRAPELLPGSKAVLYFNERDICILNLGTGESKSLLAEGTFPRYSPTDHIVFSRGGSIWAVPFNLERLKISGQEVLIQDGIYDSLEFRFSTNGTLIYIPEIAGSATRKLVLADRNGVETILTDIRRYYRIVRFSPDGESIIFELENEPNIWIHDVVRNTQNLFTATGSKIWVPSWTPDGNWITYSSNRSGVANIYLQGADGLGEVKQLFASEYSQYGDSWSDDGTLFAFSESHPITNRDIWIYTTRDSIASPFLNQQYQEHSPAISPDGDWVAYVSNKTGRDEVYLTPYPGPVRPEPVSSQGGLAPIWAPNGRELFYREGNRMMVVSVETKPSLTLGRPNLMFVSNYIHNPWDWIPYYDIHPDGKHFLMVKSDEKELSQINIVTNWFEELKDKMIAAE
jgi:serine/threonine-protein kinase